MDYYRVGEVFLVLLVVSVNGSKKSGDALVKLMNEKRANKTAQMATTTTAADVTKAGSDVTRPPPERQTYRRAGLTCLRCGVGSEAEKCLTDKRTETCSRDQPFCAMEYHVVNRRRKVSAGCENTRTCFSVKIKDGGIRCCNTTNSCNKRFLQEEAKRINPAYRIVEEKSGASTLYQGGLMTSILVTAATILVW